MYKFYNLRIERQQASSKIPAAHQLEALEKLNEWFKQQHSASSGGVLVLPTGGGKTFTTIRFLCTNPLSKGYKVLWLAHNYHLLEQAFYSFESEVKHISKPKSNRLDVRVISGTPGHCRVQEVQPRDDVLIGTLQTVSQAYKREQPQLEAYLKAADEKLFVVFDEAHHSPAPTYRKLIAAIQERFPKSYLLGLTATPTYTDKNKYGWLEKIFPQRIIYQVSAQRLMGDGILSQPKIEQYQTNFKAPEFEEEEYKKWVKSYQDLPEDIITRLAENRDRNALIAETYASNKERYGKTIIFADRWFQCEQLSEFLGNRGVRAGVIYSNSRSSVEGTISGKNENARVLEAFRRNELDVLVNILMLTEGTDIPDVQTVFLTRQTTSDILLTQMVGRALRGPRMGGTEKAYIVSFIDIWNHTINWAGYPQLGIGLADDDEPCGGGMAGLPILIDLVRRLAQQMDRSIDTLPGPFLTLLPIGWYQVEFEIFVQGSEDNKIVTELVMVFEGEEEAYERFIENLIRVESIEFSEYDISFEDKRELIKDLCINAFSDQDISTEVLGEWFNDNLLTNLFYIARHVTQNKGEKPPFFLFEERKNHDLDALAQQFIHDDLGPRALEQALQAEFHREDRYWNTIYYSYELFKQHYNACVDKLLARESEKTVAVKKASLPGQNSEVPPSHPIVKTEEEVETSTALSPVDKKDKNKSFLDFPLPLKVDDVKQWKDFICQSIDTFYHCDAVKAFKILDSYKETYWQVILNPGIDAHQIRPYLKPLMQRIEQVLEESGYRPPEIFYVNSDVRVIGKKYIAKSKSLKYSETEWLWKPKRPDIKFVVGEKIIVISGPFRDFEGEVIDIYHERSKIKALLSIFGRDTPVELDLSQFKKL